MKTSKLKKITALLAAVTSVLTVVGLSVKAKSEEECSCAGASGQCGCKEVESELHVPEPSVKKVSRVRKIGVRKSKAIDATEIARSADTLKDIFEKIREKSPSNESIAKVIISLINLQNAVDPDRAIDVRSIHFMKSGDQNTMVIDLYTGGYGKPVYEDELCRLWGDIFLAENFWNADFVRVRVTARNKKSGEPLETISCSFENVRKYLLKEISLEEFQSHWSRRKAKVEKVSKSTKPKKLKRA